MEDEREILTESISDQELERRWNEVRKRMKEEEIDFLVMQNDNEWLGGYVKWFTDVPARNAQAHTVIFPVDDEMTTITHGGKPPGDMGPPPWTLRGVKRRLTAPFFRPAYFTNTYEAELAAEVLGSRRRQRSASLEKGRCPQPFMSTSFKHLPESNFVDAADIVDQIKAIKSDEEINLIRKTAALEDKAIEYAKKAIRPGRRDFEILADIIHRATDLGQRRAARPRRVRPDRATRSHPETPFSESNAEEGSSSLSSSRSMALEVCTRRLEGSSSSERCLPSCRTPMSRRWSYSRQP